MIHIVHRPDEAEPLLTHRALDIIEEAERLHEFVNSANPFTVGPEAIRKANNRLHALYEVWHGVILPQLGPF